MGLPVIQPSRVTVMIKPVGALCNLDCTYCYYLPTKTIYGGHERRMSLRTLESVFASVLPRFGEEVTIAWQGGEPTLAGLDFFRKAIEFQNRYRRPGQQVRHALQTNGTLLDEEWCRFLHDNDFLIGLSVDGPPRFHDHYRLTNRAESSSDLVLRGMRLLQEHVVQYNILCVLNDVNVHHPDEVMGYLLNLGSRWLQFIPAVEWEPDPARPGHNNLAPYSPDPEAYGKFLCRTFDLWFSKYRLRISIREIDAVLSKLVLGVTPYCILDSSCHNQLTVEHDGSVFGCDHFVERRWQLGQIGQTDWVNSIGIDGTEEVGLTIHGTGYRKASALGGRDIHAINDVPVDVSDGQPNLAATGDPDGSWYDRLEVGRLGAFAARKQHLPEKCQSCQWRPYCHGGCPKHRPHGGDVAERTILCEAYMAFYAHAMPKMMWLADFLRKGQQPPDPTDNPDPSLAAIAATNGPDDQPKVIQRKHLRPQRPAGASIGRNDPCPCGSGLKYKRCHGRNL